MTPRVIRTAVNLLRRNLTYVHAGITHRCNLRCGMCGVYKRAGELEEATPERWREIARLLAERGATTISLGGGEPFVREDVAEVVAAFADHGFRVRVLTNGVAVNEAKVRACLAAGMADLSFSLDSLDAAVQEEFDGLPGGLDKRLANLAMLTQTLPHTAGWLINTIVSAKNLADLPRISDLAYNLGAQVSFIPVHLADVEGDAFFGSDASHAFPPEQADALRAFVNEAVADKKRRGHVANSRAFLAEIPGYLLEGRTTWRCLAGRAYLSLRPDGKASLCHHFETIDAVEVEQIAARWTEEFIRRETASCPDCLRPCWAEVALLAVDPGAMWDQVRLQTAGMSRRRSPRSEADIRRLAGLVS
ncbi:MAG: radical SAM protein [Candidatus Lernaella stagnicola]|nr:radical SAM protein [Candidatus Lernaella stagnicola]